MELIGLGILIVLLTATLIYLIHRRLRKPQRLSSVHYCENCGKRIHRNERTWYWHGAQVCLDCRKRLAEVGDQ